MTTTASPMPPIVSRPEWEKARAELLSREKELMRLRIRLPRRFQAIGTDEVHLIPTSSNIDQLRRVADVVEDFS